MGLLDQKSTTDDSFTIEHNEHKICVRTKNYAENAWHPYKYYDYPADINLISGLSRIYNKTGWLSFDNVLYDELPVYQVEASAIRRFLMFNNLINEVDRRRLLELNFKEEHLGKTFVSLEQLSVPAYNELHNYVYYMFELLLLGVDGLKKHCCVDYEIIKNIFIALAYNGYNLPGYINLHKTSTELNLENEDNVYNSILEVINNRKLYYINIQKYIEGIKENLALCEQFDKELIDLIDKARVRRDNK